MKKLSLIPIILLAACNPINSCQWEANWINNNQLRAELFDKCLVRAAEARKSTNYTTNDDEDYDDVITACGAQAYSMSRYCIYQK